MPLNHILKNGCNGDDPGCPGTKTQCFQCRGASTISGQGTKIPCARWRGKKKETKMIIYISQHNESRDPKKGMAFLEKYLECRVRKKKSLVEADFEGLFLA